jgi:hypothetical protein
MTTKTKMESMKERLQAAAGEWSDDDMPVERHISREQADGMRAQKRREQQQMTWLREQQEKQRLQLMQYEATNQALLDSVIGDDATVAHLEDESEKAQAALDALYTQYKGVCRQLSEISTVDEIDLTGADATALVDVAMKRRRAAGDEAAALAAVKAELERRIGIGEAGAGELRSEIHTFKRAALHRYCDQKIAELRPHIETVATLFNELGRAEDMIRGLGGPRQVFSSASARTTITFLVERWDKEIAEVKQFSEKY